MPELPDRPLLTVSEAADHLDVSNDIIYYLLSQKILTGIRTKGKKRGNWRIKTDCVRRLMPCGSFVRNFTDTTQVFWVTWSKPPLSSDCQRLREEHRERFSSIEVEDADSVLPRLVVDLRGPTRPQPPNDLPSSPR